MDAARKGPDGSPGRTTVRFRSARVRPADRADYLKLLGLPGEFPARLAVGGGRTLPLVSALQGGDEGEPLHLLFCEDFGTTGMGGRGEDSSGPWYRFVFGLGDGEKEGGGGSYGFGKGVLPAMSRCGTIVVYTVTQKEGPRLIAISYLDKHGRDGRDFTGRAWLNAGLRNDRPQPLHGEAARELARALGFAREGEIGSSILVLDAEIEPGRLVRGVVDHWWPALVENRLDVSVEDADGRRHSVRHGDRPDLKDFIRAFRLATKAAERDGERECFHFFSRHKMGSLGAVALNQNAALEEEDERAIPPNTVALVRDARMVVRYAPVVPRSQVLYKGVFVADESAAAIFRMMEPPAHDDWVNDENRLATLEDQPRVRAIASGFDQELKQRMRLWLKTLRPAVPPPQARLALLDEILAPFLKVGKDGPKPPPPKPSSPIRFGTLAEEREEVTGGVRLSYRYSLSLAPEWDADEIVVAASPRCVPLLDANLRADSSAKIGVWCGVEPSESVVLESPLQFRVRKDRPVVLSLVTDAFDAALAVRHELNLGSVA